MQTIHSISEMQECAKQLRNEGLSVALVPTMGALHEGHLSLVRRAREKADKLIVSLFVNPTQFGPSEDFQSYPRGLEKDLELCAAEGADIVFIPETKSIYPDGFSTYIVEEKLAKGLCGVSRPEHFRGVCTIVAKLFNICQPTVAVFGQKDAQQAMIIKRMVKDLNFDIEVEVAPTVREPDGLAMSSRNQKLTPPQRAEALKIYKALRAGKDLVETGVRQVDRLEAEVTHYLRDSRRLRVIYVATVDRETLAPVREAQLGESMIAAAVWVDEIRLIDNILL